MFDKIKDVEWANLGLLWFIGGVGKDLFNLYQSNEPGFGARLFIIAALVIIALLVCKLLLPWLAGLAIHHVAGFWTYVGYLHSLDYPFAFYLTIANKKSPLMLRGGGHGIA